MSRQVYLDITLETPHPISAQSVFQILFENGWSPIKNEEITYLPIGDNGMYDWTSKHIQIEDFMKLIGLKEDKKEIIGVNLFWQETDIGISFVTTKPNYIMIGFNINRRYLDESVYLTDFNWYAERILVCLQKHYHVSHYCFDFQY